MKFSIIMPVYNCEKYIERAICSVLQQDYENYELIIVNDGSTDGTQKIIADYSERCQKVIAINKPNSGVSDARNCGIQKACGDWMVFLDADDWIDNNYLSVLNTIIHTKDVDCIFTNLLRDSVYGGESKKMYTMQETCCTDNQLIIDQIISYYLAEITYHLQFGNCRCIGGKAYRKALIDQFAVTFPSGIKTAEDGIFNLWYIINCHSVYITDSAFYHYFDNPTSVCNTYDRGQFEDTKRRLEQMKRFVDRYSLSIKPYCYTCLESYTVLINTTVYFDRAQTAIANIAQYSQFFTKEFSVILKHRYKIKAKDRLLLLLSKIQLYPLVFLMYAAKQRIKK